MVKVVVIFISFLFNFQESVDVGKVYWNDRKIIWDDFKGVPDFDNLGVAVTSSLVNYNINYEKDSLVATIFCYLNKNSSWVKPAGRDEYTLNHEQNHFNITEIFARKFREIVSKVKCNKTISKVEITKLFWENEKALNKYQKLYDAETEHGDNFNKQEEWNAKIEMELNQLDSYKNLIVKIYLIN